MYHIFSYIQKDFLSLKQYMETSTNVSIYDVKSHLFLLRRSDNINVPDHYYKLVQKDEMSGIKSVTDLFIKGFSGFCDKYLECNGCIVNVRPAHYNDWQFYLASISPLLAISVVLQRKFALNLSDAKTYINKYISPNVLYTSLISPDISHIKWFAEKENGLCDLHAHLNGVLESDMVWQDFLTHPVDVFLEINEKYVGCGTKEQFSNVYPGLTPELFKDFLYAARYIRLTIFEIIVENCEKGGSHVNKKHLFIEKGQNTSTAHPVSFLVGEGFSLLQMEALFYVMVFQYLSKEPSEYISELFHLYILILGLSNSILVQQNNSYGFEQFDKYTQNGCREWSERSYMRRFKQLAGNKLKYINLIEGRFTPKTNHKKNEKILNDINKGWDDFLNKIQCSNLPELNIVAHFIKKSDKSSDKYRHLELREDIKHRAEILCDMLMAHNPCVKRLVGVDAAGNELSTPPETFAESFEIMRSAGIKHFTYHAGEDFYHLISGIRAVYEAIVFLKLGRGDRIGHAMACGIDPKVWTDNVSPEQDLIGEHGYDFPIYMKKGENLDNLIFLHHLITQYNISELTFKVPIIESEIIKFGHEIYGGNSNVYEYINSWLHRGSVRLKNIRNHDKRFDDLTYKYYYRPYVNEYEKIITIPAYHTLSIEEIRLVQRTVLGIMHDREIVIETLPTSNVILGHHKSFSTYQLYNWFIMRKNGHSLPPIVVGTDDAGIFDTNIYNEYCHIYCQLFYDKKINQEEIMNFIEELNRNSHIYSFRKE